MNKGDFPLFNQEITYLDSAATSQKPRVVIDALKNYYQEYNANAHRGIYPISVKATNKLAWAREVFAKFIVTRPQHIVFTKNTTESLNLLARSIHLQSQNNIVTTEIEHHSNLVPWQEAAKRAGCQIKFAKYDAYKKELQDPVALVNEYTKVFTMTGMSNVTGQIFDIKKIINQVRSKNPDTIIIIDACQYAVHNSIDVQDLDVDFLAFSAHKLYGPLGVGILYGKDFTKINPYLFGGDMIEHVSLEETTYAQAPAKFEAGTLDAGGIIGAAQAVEYIKEIGRDAIKQVEQALKQYALEQLQSLDNITIVGHNNEHYGSIISFYHNNIPALDIAQICADNNVCIRVGHHCAQPFMKALGVNATLRLSIGLYNDKDDIDKLLSCLKQAIKLFERKTQ